MSIFGDIRDALQSVPVNAVLRERVALAEQRYEVLEKQNSELTAAVARLETENVSLRTALAEYQSKDPGQLSPDAQVVLECVSKLGGEDIQTGHVAASLGIHPQRADFYLHDLSEREFLSAIYNAIYPNTFALTQKGKRYLIAHGKI